MSERQETSTRPGPAPLDLNLLPARHRPQAPAILTILLWALFVALLAMLLPSAQWFTQQAAGYQAIVAEAEQLALALSADGTAQDLDARATEVASLEARADQLETSLADLGLRTVVWSQILPAVLNSTPAGIEYLDIAESGEGLRLEGTATDELVPLLLVENLSRLDGVTLVRLESLDRMSAEPSPATPIPSPTPRARLTPTPAPTPTAPPAAPRFQFVLTLVLDGVPAE